MHMRNVVVVVVLFAGCKKKEENAAAPAPATAPVTAGSAATAVEPGPPASCQDAAKNFAKVMSADPSTDLGKAEPGIQGLMKYSYEEACDTEWSEANKSCAAKAPTSAEARACFDAKMLERLDLITKAEIEDMLKNKAANEAAKAAGSGSAAP